MTTELAMRAMRAMSTEAEAGRAMSMRDTSMALITDTTTESRLVEGVSPQEVAAGCLRAAGSLRAEASRLAAEGRRREALSLREAARLLEAAARQAVEPHPAADHPHQRRVLARLLRRVAMGIMTAKTA
jgi:hypothetical protein